MIGNPAISLIADAYNKGINKFDMDKAYQYSLRSSELLGNGERGYSTSSSVSNTLEYAYFDWCIAQIAKKLGKKDDEQIYLQKGQAYRNVFDPEVGWFRPKRRDGDWMPWPEKDARIKDDYGCVESNLYQQGWFVPHDIPGMVELMGGREKVIEDLINFFDNTPDNLHWNSYYNHANEPVHLVPFLFNRLGTPWLTQKWTRHICRNAYFNSVEGLVGNEDVGQMSAWYVLAASGIHPACPGETGYEITSPVFERVTYNLESGKKFTITSHNYLPENIYIQAAKLNGVAYNKSSIEYADIASGGHLELYMGNTPNKDWGNDK
jgi:predicted alpha-1,2-mannosidase